MLVIGSLVRKPGAFARYRFRDSSFPPCTSASPTTRCGSAGERADVEYGRTWRRPPCGQRRDSPSNGEVRDLAEPKAPEAPLLTVGTAPDLYDGLLAGSLATAGVCS